MNTSTAPGPRLDIERRGPVTIARFAGEPLGQLLPALCEPLAALVRSADADPETRVVVITSAHPDCFISHAAIPWLSDGGKNGFPLGRTASGALASLASVLRRLPGLWPVIKRLPFAGAVQLDLLHDTFVRMNRSGVIFVAAVNGSAQGIGSELMQACDLRVMADRADIFIGQFEVLIGFNPGGGGTQRMARQLGSRRALRLLLEGRPVGPQEALEIGLVDELVPPAALLDQAIALGMHLGARPRRAIEAIKRCVYIGSTLSLTEGLHLERAEFLSLLTMRSTQALMDGYVADTGRNGQLPLYTPGLYEKALRTGHFTGAPKANA